MKPNIIYNKKGQAAVELAIFGSIILIAFSTLLMYGQRLDTQQQVKMEAFRKALQKAYQRNGSVNYTYKKDTRAYNLFSGFGQGQAQATSATASVLWQKGMPGGQGNDTSESYAYYDINGQLVGDKETLRDGTEDVSLTRYPKKQKNLMGNDVTVNVPLAVWNEAQARIEEYNSEVKKKESLTGIVNTKSSDLKDTIKTVLHTRVDTAYDDNPHDKQSPLPNYYYEGQTYTYENQPETIQAIPEISQGAYYRDDINRIEYSKDTVGTTIHKERSWQTNN